LNERVVRCWNRLPRDGVNALLLEVFMARLDGSLGDQLIGRGNVLLCRDLGKAISQC